MVRELEFEPKFLNPKPAHFLSHHTASAKEQTPSQAGLSAQQGGSDTWDTATSEEVEGNLTVYNILLVPEGTILNCPSPTHTLSQSLYQINGQYLQKATSVCSWNVQEKAQGVAPALRELTASLRRGDSETHETTRERSGSCQLSARLCGADYNANSPEVGRSEVRHHRGGWP